MAVGKSVDLKKRLAQFDRLSRRQRAETASSPAVRTSGDDTFQKTTETAVHLRRELGLRQRSTNSGRLTMLKPNAARKRPPLGLALQLKNAFSCETMYISISS